MTRYVIFRKSRKKRFRSAFNHMVLSGMSEDHKKDFFFSTLSEMELKIVNRLRNILRKFPVLEERISYSVLYYFQNSRVCFIWPASIKPGPKSGVQFGFCNGYLLKDEGDLLEKGNRKQVYWITFHSPAEIQENVLTQFLEEAVALDSTLFKPNKKNSKKKTQLKPPNHFCINPVFFSWGEC